MRASDHGGPIEIAGKVERNMREIEKLQKAQKVDTERILLAIEAAGDP